MVINEFELGAGSVVPVKDPQILGALSYQFHTRTEEADAWAIAKNDGNYLFPAAYVLQKYAKGESDVPLSLPF